MLLSDNIFRFSLVLLTSFLTNAKLHLKKDAKREKCICKTEFEQPFTMADACGGTAYANFMNKVEDTLRSRCDLIDPKFCGDTYGNDFSHYDFIVVGSGSAGGVVAGRLAECGRNTVLLLEAGGPAPVGIQVPGMYFQYDQNPFVDWDYVLEPQTNACLGRPDGVCHWPRGKGLGGTALLHGMMYMRGYPQDYDDLVKNGIEGWSWKDVLPYFLRSEDNTEIGTHADEGYHGVGGPLTVERFKDHPELSKDILKAASELGYKTDIDLNGRERTGFTLAQATTKNGSRLTTMKAFVYGRIKPTNSKLHIKTNAYVSKVVVNDNGIAIGVEYIKEGKMYTALAVKEVILSAGTIGSAQILLNSGIGPKKQLNKLGIKVINNLPGVGQNIRNHASFSLYYIVKDDKSGGLRMSNNALDMFMHNNTGPMTSTGLSQITGFLHTKYSNPKEDAPDLQVFFSGYLANCARGTASSSLYNLVEEFNDSSKTIISISPTLLRPKSQGYMELRDLYATSKPKIYAGLLKDKDDVDVILEGIRFAQKLANTNALRDKVTPDKTPAPGCEDIQYDSDEYWICAIRSLTNPENHQVGSCQMGAPNDEMAVTDNKLRVRGVKNLRVIDASVFPTVPSGNLNAPVIMVAERGVQFIKDAWNIK